MHGLLEDLHSVRPVGDPHADAHGRKALRLSGLPEGLHVQQAAQGPLENAHRRETVLVRDLRQVVRLQPRPEAAPGGALWREGVQVHHLQPHVQLEEVHGGAHQEPLRQQSDHHVGVLERVLVLLEQRQGEQGLARVYFAGCGADEL